MASQRQQPKPAATSSSSYKLDARSEPFYPITKHQWRSLPEKLKLQSQPKFRLRPQAQPYTSSTMSPSLSRISSTPLSSPTSLPVVQPPQDQPSQPMLVPEPECGWRADEIVREDLYRYGAGAASAPPLERHSNWSLISLRARRQRRRSLDARPAEGRHFRSPSLSSGTASGEGEAEEEDDDDGGDVKRPAVDEAGLAFAASGDSQLHEPGDEEMGFPNQTIEDGDETIRTGGDSGWVECRDDHVRICRMPGADEELIHPPRRNPDNAVDNHVVPGSLVATSRAHNTFSAVHSLASDPAYEPLFHQYFQKSGW